MPTPMLTQEQGNCKLCSRLTRYAIRSRCLGWTRTSPRRLLPAVELQGLGGEWQVWCKVMRSLLQSPRVRAGVRDSRCLRIRTWSIARGTCCSYWELAVQYDAMCECHFCPLLKLGLYSRRWRMILAGEGGSVSRREYAERISVRTHAAGYQGSVGLYTYL
jgi:hypothetical protein